MPVIIPISHGDGGGVDPNTLVAMLIAINIFCLIFLTARYLIVYAKDGVKKNLSVETYFVFDLTSDGWLGFIANLASTFLVMINVLAILIAMIVWIRKLIS